MNIEVPFIEDKELQKRFEEWLTGKGYQFAIPRSIAAQSFIVVVHDPQDAFWIGCNHVALANKLFDGPLTRTLG
ncbi:MAG: hypothetical protein H7Y42_04910 [Chitinophagaceae bacterium]|nr:hypothetical protein [Chitinophagaceae bacterium]